MGTGLRENSSESTPTTSKELSYSRKGSRRNSGSMSDLVPQAYRFIADFDENFGEATFDSLARMFSQKARGFNLDDIDLNLSPRESVGGPDMLLIDEPEPDDMSLEEEDEMNGMQQGQEEDEMF